jgi:hypothetical protein
MKKIPLISFVPKQKQTHTAGSSGHS